MDKNDHLNEHLELCKRIYERMLRDGSWPWINTDDSTLSDDLIESGDNPRDP